MQQKNHRPEPPTSNKLIMAVVAVAILLGALYVLNGNRFPTEISYEQFR